MNEVKQVWSSFRSSTRSSTLPANARNESRCSGNSTTWYDTPTPVIVHCQDFEKSPDNETGASNLESQSVPGHDSSIIYQNSEEVSKSLEPPEVSTGQTATERDDSVLYQNTEEVSRTIESSVISKERNAGKRLSSSIELTASASVKTGADGVPTISFSFHQRDEKVQADVAASSCENSDHIVEARVDDLYDVPKSPNGTSQVSYCSVLTDEKKAENADGFQIPAREGSPPPRPANPPGRYKRDPAKRSTRSLKSGRRSYGTSDSDAYDAGIASMSGSYSDPECPEGQTHETSGGRRKLQKRLRLGRAWGKMRDWLKEEKTKIGEVVNRHAKLQAVGALSNEHSNSEDQDTKLPKINRVKCGSYDLVKARSRELGPYSRTDNELPSVSEEAQMDREMSRSPDSGKDSGNEGTPSILKIKAASSDDLLKEDSRNNRLQMPVSFSMDALNSENVNEHANSGGVGDKKETSSRSGPIGRRMLGSIRGLMASTHLLLPSQESDEAGQGGFEEVRRYVKQGGDFCKELAAILHERAELEANYAKGLSKLSGKLTKACAKDQGGNVGGGVNEAWRCVGEEMEAAAEAHRVWGIALSEQLAKPLRVGVAEAQGRSRKSIENSVDKASKSLQEWRSVAAKTKKQSFACARENERLQDLARLQSISQNQQNNNKSSVHHHMTEKEASKLEVRRRKAEDSSRRADTEFYTVSVRAEGARLEYESSVRKGAKQMELLEEERLSALKDLANVYLSHLQALAPRLQQSADRLATPVRSCNVSQDIEILKNLIRRIDSNDAANAEQLLPDFYAEHVTLAMNRERRKQALVRVLHLIRQDLEREKRGREGLETLHRAFIKTPAFAADESTQNVTDKLHHMRSMLLYLEAARYKVGGMLAELEGSKRAKHPLAEHILVSRDKQGLQQSVLKIPTWARNESFEFQDGQDELDLHLSKDPVAENNRDWDRTAGDGNSENPPDEEDFSDFDEFSSQSEDNNNQDVDVADISTKHEGIEQCRAIYQYSANLNDELSLNPGDLITVHQKQADGWWIGECRGRTGIFPATYVQVIH